MSFKKNKLNKNKYILSNLVGIISVCIVFVIGLVVIKNIDFFSFEMTQKNLTQEELVELEEKKEKEMLEVRESNKINILLAGRGGGSHDAPDLTDTIILASLDKNKKLISMLSIPRDLYVENKGEYEGKINGIYPQYYYTSEDRELGMTKLSEKITEITGEKVDYFINIDFNGFTKVVDALGGIEINVPKNFVDDQYPDGNWGYRTLVFRQGTWNFTGDNALKYARSRHSTSDFDRSLRQQQVISGVKEKIIEADYLTSPKKIKEFYNIYKEYVYTDLGITDLLGFLPILKDVSEMKMLSYNINDSCFYGSNTCQMGGFLYIPERALYGGQSVLLIDGTDKLDLGNYGEFQNYTNRIYNHQEFFIEKYKLNIFNSTKVSNLAGVLSNDIIKYGFNIPEYNSIGNTPTIYDSSVIYYNNIPEESETLTYLKEFFEGEFIRLAEPKYSKDFETKIEIVIGKDYLEQNEIFKF